MLWRPRRTLVFALVLSLSFGATPADAADPAEVLIREGVELRRAGRDADALDKFIQAYDLSHTPRAAAQLGLCQLATSNFVEAEGYLTEALAAGSDPWIARNREIIQESLEQARKELGLVIVSGGPKGALVTVNGRVVGKLPAVKSAYAAVGLATVTASAPGYETKSQKVRVQAGGSSRVEIRLEAVSSPAASSPDPNMASVEPPSTEDPQPSSLPASAESEPGISSNPGSALQAPGSWHRPAGWAAVSIGAIALGFGVLQHLSREADAKEFNRLAPCGEKDGKIFGGPTCEALQSNVSAATTWAAIGYSVGLVGSALGVFWLLGHQGNHAPEAASTTVGIGPSGIRVSGHF